MLRPCNPWDDVNRHGHISKTEGLVDTHEDGDMPHELRHETNTECLIKDSTQVTANGRPK